MLRELKPPGRKCDDENCPWHGKLKIRGRIFEGVVKSAKMRKTAIVAWERLYKLKKYERYERRRSKVAAHNPPCIDAKEGDKVIVGECRPLSKTKRFAILAKI